MEKKQKKINKYASRSQMVEDIITWNDFYGPATKEAAYKERFAEIHARQPRLFAWGGAMFLVARIKNFRARQNPQGPARRIFTSVKIAKGIAPGLVFGQQPARIPVIGIRRTFGQCLLQLRPGNKSFLQSNFFQARNFYALV